MTLQAVFLAGLGVAAEAPDMRTFEADLKVPIMGSGPPAAGRRFKEVLPEMAGTRVYHVTYLPTDWRETADSRGGRGVRWPVIVEYAGNGGYRSEYGDVSTGRVEGSKLGFGITAGQGAIWVCLPYLNAEANANVTHWWGDPPRYEPGPTLEYCKQAVPWICEKYDGDPNRVILVGFSRGAIACNYIGLYDRDIARLWRGFVAFSHYDGVVERWGYPQGDAASALERLKRLGNRPQFICAEEGDGNHSVAATRAYLESSGVAGRFVFRGTGFRNHNDAWVLRPSPAREELRRWYHEVVR